MNFNNYLRQFKIEKGDKKPITHTRIGDTNLGIYGGSYSIPVKKMSEFYKLYSQHVFVNKQQEFLTERQHKSTGPICIDMDFRYPIEVEERNTTTDHLLDIIA